MSRWMFSKLHPSRLGLSTHNATVVHGMSGMRRPPRGGRRQARSTVYGARAYARVLYFRRMRTKLTTFVFWTTMAALDIALWRSTAAPLRHVVDGALLVIALFLATLSGVGIARLWLIRR